MQYLHHGIETHRNRNPTVLLLASGWFWSPRPQTSVKSRNCFSFRRHPQTCDRMQSSRFPWSQTLADTAASHSQALWPGSQTSADICPERLKRPQTSADTCRQRMFRGHTICNAIILLLYAIRRLRLASHRSQALRRHH